MLTDLSQRRIEQLSDQYLAELTRLVPVLKRLVRDATLITP